jgi:catechol 2,3-dioxygenase-like lactoylglutathione lyase family enzyme
LIKACALTLACALLAGAAHAADPPGHVTGVGGVFIKSADPKALAAWYRDVLGIHLEDWGGAMLRVDLPGHPPVVTWNAFPAKTTYFAPSPREVMLDFAVDNMDAFLARLAAHGVRVIERDDREPNGRFAWVLDPDGTKLEFWEPKR